jgi:hypothetical protein
MLDIFVRDRNTNVIRVFFTQLSMIAPIHLNCILEHIETNNVYKCVVSHLSIDWVKNITLKEIRNHILFIMLREYGTVLDDTPYIDKSIHDPSYLKLYKPDSPLDVNVDKLEPLLQTLYYMRHVDIILNASHVNDVPEDVCMYSEWIKQTSDNLSESVYQNFHLLLPIL